MEVERKFQVAAEALPDLRARLANMGECLGTRIQDDVFFQHPSRDLVASDEALRLRTTPDGQELTYKGPRIPGDSKRRPETNVACDGDMQTLLSALGFVPAARLCKQRETWRLPEVEVLIDHIEGLGDFVEIEATGTAPDEAIDAAQAALGLAGPGLQASYLELALDTGASAASRLN